MKELIKTSAKVGADILKFQIFKYDCIATEDYYQYKDYKKLFFKKELWNDFIKYADSLETEIAVDVLDEWGFNIIKENRKYIDYVKITPSILFDDKLCEKIFNLNLNTFVGIGGYKFSEIEIFLDKYQRYSDHIILFLGFQGFPTALKNINISRISYYKNKFNCKIGFADHCNAEDEKEIRMLIPQFALIAGADYLEKHITLDRTPKGYDYFSALEPNEFEEMIKKMKKAQLIHGNPQHINQEEKSYRRLFRKLVYKKGIKKSDILNEKDLCLKRTDKDGVLASNLHNVVGKKLKKDVEKNQPVKLVDVTKPKVGVFIQVRSSSTRLKDKAFLPLNNIPVIQRVINNSKEIKNCDLTAITTSKNDRDKVFKEYAIKNKIPIFYGAEDDVIKRYVGAAEEFKVDVIVRVTGDCPVISYEIADKLIASHLEHGADYTYIKGKYIMGINSEVYSVNALKKILNNLDTSLSEYMTFFLRNNPDIFLLNGVKVDEKYLTKKFRLTIDEKEDYELLKIIFERLNIENRSVSFDEIYNFLKNNPSLLEINAAVKNKWINTPLEKKLIKITKIKKQNE